MCPFGFPSTRQVRPFAPGRFSKTHYFHGVMLSKRRQSLSRTGWIRLFHALFPNVYELSHERLREKWQTFRHRIHCPQPNHTEDQNSFVFMYWVERTSEVHVDKPIEVRSVEVGFFLTCCRLSEFHHLRVFSSEMLASCWQGFLLFVLWRKWNYQKPKGI